MTTTNDFDDVFNLTAEGLAALDERNDHGDVFDLTDLGHAALAQVADHDDEIPVLDWDCGKGGHLALTGIDATPIDDPEKVWLCITCGTEYTADEVA